MNTSWKSRFAERELKEIEFCCLYAKDFSHGTDGHNIKLIVAKMAKLLDGGKLTSPSNYDFLSEVDQKAVNFSYVDGNERSIEAAKSDNVITLCAKCGRTYCKSQSHSCTGM